MDMRQVIENIRHAGLQVEADHVLAYVNRAQTSAEEMRALLVDVETLASDMSNRLTEIYRRLGMIREQPTAPADT